MSWGRTLYRSRNKVFGKKLIWVGPNSHVQLFLLVDQIFKSLSDFFSPDAGGIAVDTLAFRFWISASVPKAFAVKVWLYPKSPQIFTFWPQIFLGEDSPHFRTWIIKLNILSMMWQSFTAIGRKSSEISQCKKMKHQQWNIRPPVTNVRTA